VEGWPELSGATFSPRTKRLRCMSKQPRAETLTTLYDASTSSGVQEHAFEDMQFKPKLT
jgi:hypothetical protein